ncbi:MAG: hypothetical protein BWK79_20030 [Beggiatoa sp. IS2]|nr:MAG: hypothetical protein BWK79_20030 [Beggiatoa sp. IS2]
MIEKRPKNFVQARRMARQRVLQALYQWQLTAQDVHTIEDQFLSEQNIHNVQKMDTDHFQTLLRGILQHTQPVDMAFAPFLDREIIRLDPIELATLRIGCYELLYCPDVPWRTAINEAVDLAKMFGATESHKYVNGILDKVAHNRQKTVGSWQHLNNPH